MAIYTTGTWKETDKKIVARSSKIKATDCGHIYDLVNETKEFQNGMNAKVGNETGDGLQLREATVPDAGDKVAFVCSVPSIYEDYTTEMQAEYNFTNKIGEPFKAYELVEDDVFGVSDYGFTTILNGTKGVQFGSYVTVDGAGKWKEVASAPAATTNGFIGIVAGFENYMYDTIVLVRVIQNEQVD